MNEGGNGCLSRPPKSLCPGRGRRRRNGGKVEKSLKKKKKRSQSHGDEGGLGQGWGGPKLGNDT